MNVYLTEPGTILKCKGGKYVVEKEGEKISEIPSKKVENVNIYSGANITSPCITRLIKDKSLIIWFNASNQIIGYAQNLYEVKSELIAKQINFRKEENLCLELAKKIIKAKLTNAYVILKRYNRNRSNAKILFNISEIKKTIKEIDKCKTILNLYGIEGIGSKLYFNGVNELLENDYKFKNRNKKPPKDPYNTLISFGYSIVFSEIVAIIQQEGLSPYFGFMHTIKNGHPALASDIIEEFRYQIVDSVVISALNNHEYKIEDFVLNSYNGGVYLDMDLRKKFISKIISKLNSLHKYNNKEERYIDTIKNQVKSYKNIINTKNIGQFKTLIVR